MYLTICLARWTFKSAIMLLSKNPLFVTRLSMNCNSVSVRRGSRCWLLADLLPELLLSFSSESSLVEDVLEQGAYSPPRLLLMLTMEDDEVVLIRFLSCLSCLSSSVITQEAFIPAFTSVVIKVCQHSLKLLN